MTKAVIALWLLLILPGCAPHLPGRHEPSPAARTQEQDLLPGLAARLNEFRSDRAIFAAIIDPDPAVTAEQVVVAVDAAREAGARPLDLAAYRLTRAGGAAVLVPVAGPLARAPFTFRSTANDNV